MFYSILFPTREQYEKNRQTEAPECFKDLNLNQIFDPILNSTKEFGLETFFFTSLYDREVITYRQDVLRELEDSTLRALLSDFSKTIFSIGQNMNTIRPSLTSGDSWHNNYLTRGRMLDYADRYCHTICVLVEELSKLNFQSAGLRRFAEFLSEYHMSKSYTELLNHIKRLRDAFAEVEYCMLIKNGTIRVRKFEGQANHSTQILSCFEKFRQGDVKDYRHKLSEEPHAAHVEVAVLNMVAELYKDIFLDLTGFCTKYSHFDNETVLRFSSEIQFYLVWLDSITPLRQAGLQFCYPILCDTTEHLYVLNGFDLALARKEYDKTVANDFVMCTPEHIIVVTGPNQGGKTTFARAFGQTHYFASLGLCVPGQEAAIFLFDSIFTHFGREEDLSTLNGKLQDDLIRLHMLLDKATSKSVIIVNEIFASTTLSDALFLGRHMMDRFVALGAPVILVTFLDELAMHGLQTVSMMSIINEDDPSSRTFKILRKPPDGLAYAVHIARKHGLTYEQLCGRVKK